MPTALDLTPTPSNPMVRLLQRIAALEQQVAALQRSQGMIPVVPLGAGADLNNLSMLPALQQSRDGAMATTYDQSQPLPANQTPKLWVKVNGRWRVQSLTP